MIDILITGTGRCGTVYLAKLLNLAEIPCSHENIYKAEGHGDPTHNSTVSQREGLDKLPENFRAESSMYAAPFVSEFEGTVVHVTRHPLKVIRSFVYDLGYFTDNLHEQSEWSQTAQKFIMSHLPGIMSNPTPLSRGAYFYIYWNQLIESAPRRLHHRIEDDPEILLSYLDAPKRDAQLTDHLCNSYSKRHTMSADISWDDIPIYIRGELSHVSARYGYEDFDS